MVILILVLEISNNFGLGADSGVGLGAGPGVVLEFIGNILILKLLGIFFLHQEIILGCLKKVYFQLALDLYPLIH